jgi:hypothetical protein
MGWFDSASSCDGDKDWECTYEDPETWEQWCVDRDGSCPSWDDAGFLIEAKPAGGNGGW